MCGADRGSEEVLEKKGTLFLPFTFTLLEGVTGMLFPGCGISDCIVEQPYSSQPSFILHLSHSLYGE